MFKKLFTLVDLKKVLFSFQGIDEKTDLLTDTAVDSVKKSVSSFWRFASGYAQQVKSASGVPSKFEKLCLNKLSWDMFSLTK
jgi:hypothetical protein